MRKSSFILSSFFTFVFAQDSFPPNEIQKSPYDVHVDLIEPTYKNGILKTDKGGVITAQDFRLQADKIQYLYTVKEGRLIHKAFAQGNILLQYQNRVFVGKKLTLDLTSKQGVIEEGTTQYCPWYITSEKIYLYPNRHIVAKNTSFTACEETHNTWDIRAKKVEVDHHQLTATGVNLHLFQAFSIPFFSFKTNLRKKDSHPVLGYKLKFIKFRPKVSLCYQIYNLYDLYVYLRAEYLLPKEFWKNPNWQKGFGGAIETDYVSNDKNKKFLTRSYVANDVLIDDLKQKTRYRLQGEGCYLSDDKKTLSRWTWDKYSDRKMPQDFKSTDFEINSKLRSELFISSQKDQGMLYFYLHPRLNSFETIKQDLPSLTLRSYPQEKREFIYDQWIKTSYLDLKYSDDNTPFLQDFDSGRLQTYHNLYRPINLSPLTITPNIGVTGILYTDSPTQEAKGYGVVFAGFYAKTDFYKVFSGKKHIIQPYLQYEHVKTSSNVDSHYIFSIEDGITNLSKLTLGCKNLVFVKNSCHQWVIDLYSHLFYDQHKIDTLQKVYCDFSWNLPSLEIILNSAWDVEHKVLDHSNLLSRFTYSEDLAFSFDFRYRSKYAWRKGNNDSFFLDVKRSQDDLLLSPLSDRRITVLSNIFYRINHYFSLHLQTHHGFFRKNESPYNEFKIDLITSLSTYWKATFSFQHQEGGNTFGFSFKLIK